MYSHVFWILKKNVTVTTWDYRPKDHPQSDLSFMQVLGHIYSNQQFQYNVVYVDMSNYLCKVTILKLGLTFFHMSLQTMYKVTFWIFKNNIKHSQTMGGTKIAYPDYGTHLVKSRPNNS